MKRSLYVGLALIGTAGLLVSCGEEEDPKSAVFESVDQCAASGTYTRDDCQKNFDAAKADAAKNTPAFSQKDMCEKEFGVGNCESKSDVTNSDGTQSWLPIMAGFMIGNMIGNMSNNHGPSVYPQAVYRDRERKYVNSGGYFISRGIGPVTVSRYGGALGSPSSAPSSRITTTSKTSSFSSVSTARSTSFSSSSARGGFGSIGGVSS